MDFLVHEWSRYIWWLGQGQNATVMLVLITGCYVLVTVWYAYLTHRMAKSVARQATAMLQPALSFSMQVNDDGTGHLTIQNVGSHPVVLLDVRLGCFPMGRKALFNRFGVADDSVISVWRVEILAFDFKKEFNQMHLHSTDCGYQLLLVASDLGRQVIAVYEHLPVLSRTTCRLGMPYRVRAKYAIRRWMWRYYRIQHSVQARLNWPKSLTGGSEPRR